MHGREKGMILENDGQDKSKEMFLDATKSTHSCGITLSFL